jgi:hypothetical protein
MLGRAHFVERGRFDRNRNADDTSALLVDVNVFLEETTEMLLVLDGKIRGDGDFIPGAENAKCEKQF